MTVRFLESFQHYTTLAQLASKWGSGVPVGSIGNTYPRWTGANYYIPQNASIQRTLDNQATWVVGFALRYISTGGSVTLLDFLDGTSSQVFLRINADNTLSFVRGSTVLGTTSFSLISGTWYYIEAKVTINNTTGVCEVRVNGDTKLSLTSQNTRQSANNYANIVKFGSFNNTPQWGLTDIYIADGNAAQTYLGDIRVKCLFPSGAGATTQWTPSAGSNYQNVDESTPNDDTDYNLSSVAGQIDTYAMDNLAANDTPLAVQWIARLRKDDAGTRTIRRVLRSGGANYEGSNVNVSDTYNYYTEVLETDPATGVAWTNSGVNAVEAGIKLQA